VLSTLTLLNTYIVSPADLVHPRIGLDVTFEVYIDSFSYRTGIQVTSQFQTHNWHICNTP